MQRATTTATGFFAEDIEDIATLARSHGYERIVWLTLHANVSYTSPDDTGFAEVFERSNATLRQIVEDGTYPEIVIADWATFARDQHDWFSDDGIHLRTAGTYAAGDYISRKMAFLDARPCPQPAYAGVEPIDPCPNPDVHGPVIDLESLYPLGALGTGCRLPAVVGGLEFVARSTMVGTVSCGVGLARRSCTIGHIARS